VQDCIRKLQVAEASCILIHSALDFAAKCNDITSQHETPAELYVDKLDYLFRAGGGGLQHDDSNHRIRTTLRFNSMEGKSLSATQQKDSDLVIAGILCPHFPAL
jgi:hypothetical protein